MTANRHESVTRADRYRQHVQDLAAAFGVRLNINAAMPPHAAGAAQSHAGTHKQIMIVPVIDETTYAVALHELGHCLHPTGMLASQYSSLGRRTGVPQTISDVRMSLLEERSAWEWAHQYALEWTEPMTFVERISLASYESAARRLGVKT